MTFHCLRSLGFCLAALLLCSLVRPLTATSADVDFNRDIRPILSNTCYKCHGPDEAERQADLRLDTAEGARADLGGYAAVVPGKPEESALIERVTESDPYLRMPPKDSGAALTEREIQLLTDWVKQGAEYARHWSYEKPRRPELPEVSLKSWPRNEIDHFILSRLEKEGLKPSPEADRYALIRRLSLDLTGLPPTLDEVDRFVIDKDPEAYEKLVDRLLAKPAFGEHWARKWLDLARYADSAGYADDPPRTIWAYRDHVIRAFNKNTPFDQFTIEQIAGDLLPDPTDEQLIATAFHRNTLTNNEGGTNDEEFRNVAIVDRVNTTMAVWMGTTINCCQCHNHKYDPLTQEEFFRLFAIFNNSADADKRNESPLLEVWSEEQEQRKAEIASQIATLEQRLSTPTAELLALQRQWEQRVTGELPWQVVKPVSVTSEAKQEFRTLENGSVVTTGGAKSDTYSVELNLPATDKALTGVRLEALADKSLPGGGPGHAGGNFVITGIRASTISKKSQALDARYVRVGIPGKQKILSLAEVQVFSGGKNIAREGTAKQSSTDYDGHAKLALDGNTDGDYFNAKSTTHTAKSDNPWWEVDLKSTRAIDRVVLWNRTDGALESRLSDFHLQLLDEKHQPVWERTVAAYPNPSSEFSFSGERQVRFSAAHADDSQGGFEPRHVIAPQKGKPPYDKGWAVGGATGKDHALTLIPSSPIKVAGDTRLRLIIEQQSKHENHTLGRFRVSVTTSPAAAERAPITPAIARILKTEPAKRSPEQQTALTKFFTAQAPEFKADRDKLAALRKEQSSMKPYTTVPIMRELPEGRETFIQIRGNFLNKDKKVTEGVPAAFHPLDIEEGATPDRLDLARWLVSRDNPLTARVAVNRYWETFFGRGIVVTSEEFGTQGELPSHPRLLDWLAVEFMESGWDIKATLKKIVMSATYRQSSKVTPALLERDPDNVLYARGPRFRLPAETIRDQALFVGGLLSPKMFGPPVKPPQPKLGINAAFGSGIDWKTSQGEDRYRRGLYTMWRRSNPYPSMAAFDAPNREVCTVRRDRTNTPLQALVTLNDPVYVEAAQGLARRIAKHEGTTKEKVEYGFRVCLARHPTEKESERLVKLYESAHAKFTKEPELAKQLATDPLGPLPERTNAADLAAWTLCGNVLLNLDEMFLKR